MKKSTVKLLIFTFAGILVACFLYIIESKTFYYAGTLQQQTVGKMHAGIYIAPFIGFIYWLFAPNIED